MAIVMVFGRMARLGQEKNWEVQKVNQLKQEMEEVKSERDFFKKQVSRPLRDRVVEEIWQVFGSRAQEALAVIQCENNPDKPDYNPYSVNFNKNGSTDHGVGQINSLWVKVYGDKFKYDWKENIRVMKAIFDRSGDWRQWYSSQKCHGMLAKG